MARSFDSDHLPSQLSFTENVSCLRCGETFEGYFFDYTQSLTVEDLTEPPRGNQVCPWCEHHFDAEMTGWMLFSEAG